MVFNDTANPRPGSMPNRLAPLIHRRRFQNLLRRLVTRVSLTHSSHLLPLPHGIVYTYKRIDRKHKI